MKRKRKKGVFDDMQNAAVGMAGLGVTAGVVAGVDSHLPAGATGMSGSMRTLTSFAPIISIGVGAGTALKTVKKLRTKKKKSGYY